METNALIPVRIRQAPASLAWAEGMVVRLPHALLTGCGLATYLDADGGLHIPTDGLDIPVGEPEALRTRAAFTEQLPVSSRLPISYQYVPSWLRSLLATTMGRWQHRQMARWAAFPGWPLDLSADFLADLAGYPPSPFRTAPTPVILSHDLDSAEGLRHAVRWFLPLEEAVGARSSNYIVPCSWPIDHGLLGDVKARGHEVGIHGYDHSNRTPFASPQERQTRLQGAQELIAQYDIIGYRAPSLVRTRALLQELATFYRYDSSIPTSGGLFPVPNNGCASARPFRIEGMAELPLSLPRDGSLRFFGYSPADILTLWIQCAEDIARSGGVVVLLTHCEARFSGNPPMLRIYRQFLEYITASARFVWGTPQAVLTEALGLECYEHHSIP